MATPRKTTAKKADDKVEETPEPDATPVAAPAAPVAPPTPKTDDPIPNLNALPVQVSGPSDPNLAAKPISTHRDSHLDAKPVGGGGISAAPSQNGSDDDE